jgi:hypothetical protein
MGSMYGTGAMEQADGDTGLKTETMRDRGEIVGEKGSFRVWSVREAISSEVL